MDLYDEEEIQMFKNLECGDARRATEFFTTRFHEKFLQPIGVLNVFLVHLVAWRGSLKFLKFLHKRKADIHAKDKKGRSAVYYAAHRGNDKMVKWLLEKKVSIEDRIESFTPSNEQDVGQSLPVPDCCERTPLHDAVKNNHAEVVKLLVKAGANVNVEDSRGITPLLLAGSAIEKMTSSEICKYNCIVQTLVSAEASPNVVHPDTGIRPLHTASKLGCLKATEALLKVDPSPLDQCKKLRTVLYFAASAGNAEVLRKLLERFKLRDLINSQDRSKYTPLHVAAFEGHSECLQILIDNGGNLLAKTDKGHTVIDFILTKMPKPISFLNNILSSCVTMEENTILVNTAVLAPKEELQMEVVMSLITVTTNMKQTILQHPLVEMYLWVKWSELKIYFHILLVVHVLLVLSLSGYSITMWRPEINFLPWNKILLGFFSCILLFYNLIIQVLMVPSFSRYLKQLETWLSISFAGISLAVSIGSFTYSQITTISEGNELHDDRQYPPQWILHSVSVAILLAYMQTMVLIGHFPQWGYYTLVFFTVLKNILVLFPMFLCLIVGFALNFAVLFHENDQFRNFWNSVVKTVVMMMGEYEYGDLFSEKNGSSFLPVTSKIVFLIFVLASMVLVNLMIGVAVDDIQGLKKKGHILQLEKQAEFVNHLERLASYQIFQSLVAWLPSFELQKSMLSNKNWIRLSYVWFL